MLAERMLESLYGKHAAALYAQAADFNKTARFYYMKAEDAYYLANAQASYDDWRRARRQWDYFYRLIDFTHVSLFGQSVTNFCQAQVNPSEASTPSIHGVYDKAWRDCPQRTWEYGGLSDATINSRVNAR